MLLVLSRGHKILMTAAAGKLQTSMYLEMERAGVPLCLGGGLLRNVWLGMLFLKQYIQGTEKGTSTGQQPCCLCKINSDALMHILVNINFSWMPPQQNQQSQAKFPCINHIHSTWSPVFSCIRHPDWEPANMTGCTCLLSQPVGMNWKLNYKHKSFSLFVSIGAVPAEDAAERKVEDDERMTKVIQIDWSLNEDVRHSICNHWWTESPWATGMKCLISI